jgi:hypothetical protein
VGSSPASSISKWRRARLAVLAVIDASLLVALGILAFVPSRTVTAANGTLTAKGSCGPYCPAIHEYDSISLPNGPTATVSWSEENDSSIVVTVGNGGPPVCSWTAGSGTCDFHSNGGNYTIHAYAVPPFVKGLYIVQYTFSYYVPYI